MGASPGRVHKLLVFTGIIVKLELLVILSHDEIGKMHVQ